MGFGAIDGIPTVVTWAHFVRRKNRFVVEIVLCSPGTGGAPSPLASPARQTTASMANPGKLREFLLPDVLLGVVPGPVGGKHPWRVVCAQLPDKQVVFLDTGATNRVARWLLEHRHVPALADYQVERQEVPLPEGRSRIDFLLRHRTTGALRYLEVKSCSLFNGPWALFPDAVTARGRRHVEELAAIAAREPGSVAVLMVIHSAAVRYFVPEVHADPALAATMYSHRKTVPIIPVGVSWSSTGEITAIQPEITIPWDVVAAMLPNGGSYLLLLQMEVEKTISVGALGPITFAPGWYLYVGSAEHNLSQRISRHRVAQKARKHWHIDYLRPHAALREVYPIQEPVRREEILVREFGTIANGEVPRFGASDSPLSSHLLFFESDPRTQRSFVEMVMQARRRFLDERRES